jgi:hypothetical protein
MQRPDSKLFMNKEKRTYVFVDIFVVCITPRGITYRLQGCISVLAAVAVVVRIWVYDVLTFSRYLMCLCVR